MQVVFEELPLPESGAVELTVQRSFEIKVTAAEAQRKVNRWLSWEVSMLIMADPPTLHIGEQVVWRVPAWIGLTYLTARTSYQVVVRRRMEELERTADRLVEAVQELLIPDRPVVT